MKRWLIALLLPALAVTGAMGLGDARAQGSKPLPLEVTAKLVKIPGKFPPDDLYNYAYVMQYQVVGGKRDKQTLLVAHYKPRRKRSAIKGRISKRVKGSLKRFRQGDLHKLRLVPLSRKVFKGAVVDDFFAKDRKTQRYWSLRVDPAKK